MFEDDLRIDTIKWLASPDDYNHRSRTQAYIALWDHDALHGPTEEYRQQAAGLAHHLRELSARAPDTFGPFGILTQPMI
jgi:hypothetical protein